MAPHRLHLPFVSSQVEDLLLWRSLEKSGAVVAAATVLYLLVELTGISLVSLLANLLLALIVVSFVWNNLATFAGSPTMPVPELIKNGVKDSDVKAFADQATTYVNKGLGFLFRLLSGKDIVLVGKVALALLVISKVSSYFTSLGLLYTAFILAFTLPKIYELKKPEIDSFVTKSKDQLNSMWAKKAPQAAVRE
eukprot:jgi/Botrbrau1/20938/Bobra.0135s0066.1